MMLPESLKALQHASVTHLLEIGYDICTILELTGHRDSSTTMIYTQILNKGGSGVRSLAKELLLG